MKTMRVSEEEVVTMAVGIITRTSVAVAGKGMFGIITRTSVAVAGTAAGGGLELPTGEPASTRLLLPSKYAHSLKKKVRLF